MELFIRKSSGTNTNFPHLHSMCGYNSAMSAVNYGVWVASIIISAWTRVKASTVNLLRYADFCLHSCACHPLNALRIHTKYSKPNHCRPVSMSVRWYVKVAQVLCHPFNLSVARTCMKHETCWRNDDLAGRPDRFVRPNWTYKLKPR